MPGWIQPRLFDSEQGGVELLLQLQVAAQLQLGFGRNW